MVLKGIFETDQSVAASRVNVPTGVLVSDWFHETVLRNFDRALGRTVLDAEN